VLYNGHTSLKGGGFCPDLDESAGAYVRGLMSVSHFCKQLGLSLIVDYSSSLSVIQNLSERMQKHCSHCTTIWEKMERYYVPGN